MAQSVEPYKNLNHALRKMRGQIIDGLPYAISECPKFQTPNQVFDWLKQRTVYKKDPKGRELFQTLPTLLSGERTGKPGAGDCDCFTIGAVTLMAANGMENCGIVLAGRSKVTSPVHIWAYTDDVNGDTEYLDLTNKNYNQLRHYNYIQHIPFKISPIEKKTMILELAESANNFFGFSAKGRKQPKPKKAARKEYRVEKKELKRAEKLDGLLPLTTQTQPEIAPEVDENYTYLPESNYHVRDDQFDGMSAPEFQNAMLAEGVPVGTILKKSDKRVKRKKRAETIAKKAIDPWNILGLNPLSAGRKQRKNLKATTKASNKTIKAEAKAEKKTARSNRDRMSGADKAKAFTKLLDTTGQTIGMIKGKEFIPTPEGEQPEQGKENKNFNTAKTINVFGMELTPMQAGLGGIAAVAVAIGVAKAIKK